MGVNGLWTVIQPCARPTNLATLNRKRLAVDASIWIYQFLKAVRDKEGNALRNSHVVGFFRRICKLLWFGIQPVFVFDGGAPALKRATIQARKRRREGRRDDAVRTAGKLLAVQMQRLADEEKEKRRIEQEEDAPDVQQEEPLDLSKVVYVDEIGMSERDRTQTRKFHKKDAYHLPELEGGIAAMGKPDDPRIMSVEELEEYARQFHSGEDVNLYDFSKIDFDGEFFKSLPPPDRYNILNAARLRSRLRMGLSKEQLDDMFPDRMAFSKFQIERVQERNRLTQRLMLEVGMTGLDLTLGVNGRVAGEKDREYILVKNDGVEGGWALGVVSKEKDVGEAHKPIDVDAIEIQYQAKDEEDVEDDDDFEDVPIEGLNRLPKLPRSNGVSHQAALDAAENRRRFYDHNTGEQMTAKEDEGSLFVGGHVNEADGVFNGNADERLHPEEEDDINQAIALSLRNQHGVGAESDAEEEFEDVQIKQPEWTQKSVVAQKPITSRSGAMIAHIVNNRANAAVPKRKDVHPVAPQPAADSDSDEDLQTVLAKSRKMKRPQPRPVIENKKNPFDGPLPFPKLDWGSSLFSKKTSQKENTAKDQEPDAGPDDEMDMAGGFEIEEPQGDKPKPLPPWLADQTDIRESLKQQQASEKEINAEDRAQAEEEERQRQRERQEQLVEIASSSEDESDVEILDRPPPKVESPKVQLAQAPEEIAQAQPSSARGPSESRELPPQESPEEEEEPELEDVLPTQPSPPQAIKSDHLPESSVGPRVLGLQENLESAETEVESPEPEMEDVPAAEPVAPQIAAATAGESVDNRQQAHMVLPEDDDLFADLDYNELSDADDEELLAQMDEEAEEHARFASELNQKSAQQNKEDYEKELRALRSQQKKDRRDADEVTQVMVTECQALLRLFGIPYITAPMEAEAQCAALVKLGLVDGIVTDDSDTFLFGGTRVYKNMFNSNKFVECYLETDIEKEMSLSREQLISLAQLLGSDYTEGLPGVGPVTAVEILSEFPGQKGLEDFREWWTSVQSQPRPAQADLSSPFRKKFRKSQGTKLFLPPSFPSPAVYDAYLHPEVDDSTEAFQWGVPNLEGLRQFLMATIGWSKERTDEVLVPVIKDMNKREAEGTQSNITRFFGGTVGAGARDAFAPRQRAQTSKRMVAAVDKLRSNVSGQDGADGGQPNGSRKRRRTTRAEDHGAGDEEETGNA
ncbi:DNA repair protein rad13 [Paramyrothecium foliicola]|nr:DNA repair protein rad13 [Paramyrothecium foliicola]